jgi:hypothetical protein
MPYKNRINKLARDNQRKGIRKETFFSDKVCANCGTKQNLCLHHINPNLKIDSQIWHWKESRREQEIRKCEILCMSCHTTLHNHEREKKPIKHGTPSGYRRGCRCYTCKTNECRRVMKYKILYNRDTLGGGDKTGGKHARI